MAFQTNSYAQIPVADFSAGYTYTCTGGSISFTDLTTNAPTSWLWDFGDGGTSTLQNPTHAYTTPATYTVMLIATNSFGSDTIVKTSYITVGANPSPTFIPTAPTVCLGDSVSITASGATTYTWWPSTGLSASTGTTVNASPSTTTSYMVTGTLGGCTGTNSVTVTVNPNPVITIVPNPVTICAGSCVTLTASGCITYSWSNSFTGSPMTICPATTTHYTVTGTDMNSCTATSTVAVIVDSALVISVNVTNASCSTCADGSATVNVLSGTPPYNYIWSQGSTTQSIINLVWGYYYFTVTDANGCMKADSCFIGVGNCAANFNLVPDSLVQHLYYAINLSSGVPPLHYVWSWGDGTTDTIAYPSHTYSLAGWYNICVTISDSVGCSSTFCDSSTIAKSGNTIITVMVIDPTTVGVREIKNLNSQLFPNPFSNSSTLLLSAPIQNATFTVYDMPGKEIKRMTNLSGKEIIIQRENMKAGMYFFRIEDKNGVIGKGKFVVE